MRNLAILLAVFGLAGCNLVYSDRPLFRAGPSPQAEAGLWLIVSKDCAVDPQAPVETWPACAEHQQVAAVGRQAFRLFRGGEILMRDGDPLIVQVRESRGHGRKAWFYSAGLASAYGADGRVTEFRFWPVQCGPPPPPPAEGETHPRYVTHTPLPGLRIAGDDCRAQSADAVRRAARASEAWADNPTVIRWIRAEP